VLVADASVLTSAVAGSDARGVALRRRLEGAQVATPAHLRVEVASALRSHERGGLLSSAAADVAVDHLGRLPLWEVPVHGLLPRAWELRHNVTPYDACYVALAEALRCPLLTADRRLANAPGVQCEVELV
jgi:predicted nucleic acid-binding protein